MSEKFNLADYIRTIESGLRPAGGVNTESGDIPSLGGENIRQEGGMNYETIKLIPRDFFENLNRGILQEGDVLINKDGANTGKVGIYIPAKFKEAAINEHLFLLRGLDGLINQHFLYYSFLSDSGQNIISKQITGTAQPGLNSSFVDKYPFNPPSFDVQQKIAKILTTCDAVIEKTQSSIAKYKSIRQGIMHDLFTRGIDLQTGKLRPSYKDAPELYKQSKLGWIPRKWDEKELGKCGTFRKGGNIPKYALAHTGIGCILYGQLYTTFDNIIRKVESKVPKSILEGMTPIKFGSVLFAGSGETHEEIGKCAVLLIEDEEVYGGGDVIILDLYEEYFKPFFGYYLNFNLLQSQKSKLGQGSSVIHIYANHLSSVNISLPPKNEQEKIFEIIDQIETKLQSEQTYLQKIQKLKKGLMEDLLSGRKMVTFKQN